MPFACIDKTHLSIRNISRYCFPMHFFDHRQPRQQIVYDLFSSEACEYSSNKLSFEETNKHPHPQSPCTVQSCSRSFSSPSELYLQSRHNISFGNQFLTSIHYNNSTFMSTASSYRISCLTTSIFCYGNNTDSSNHALNHRINQHIQ